MAKNVNRDYWIETYPEINSLDVCQLQNLFFLKFRNKTKSINNILAVQASYFPNNYISYNIPIGVNIKESDILYCIQRKKPMAAIATTSN